MIYFNLGPTGEYIYDSDDEGPLTSIYKLKQFMDGLKYCYENDCPAIFA